MKTKRLLILEDDVETVSELLFETALLEDKLNMFIDVTVYANSLDVKHIVNKQSANTFDVILLDRDCGVGGSFHVLDIEKFGPDRIVSISSIPEWNEEAEKRGVRDIVLKDFDKLPEFAKKVSEFMETKLMKRKT